MNNTQPILIVDDDEEDRYLMQLSICELNWSRLKLLESAEHLIAYLNRLVKASSYPSLILLDYNMPRINGEEALAYLKADDRFRSIPVIVYSTVMTEVLKSRLTVLGAAFCYQKSFSTQSKRLAHAIKTIIRKKERQQHLYSL